jgi:hypothetical protein
LPVGVQVDVAIGPSATSATPFNGITVRLSAVTAVTTRFLFKFAALKAPAVRRPTCPALMPSVSQEPAARATVNVGPVPRS